MFSLVLPGVKNADENELRSIASEPDNTHVYNVADFNIMSSIVEGLTKTVCEQVEQQDKDIKESKETMSDCAVTLYIRNTYIRLALKWKPNFILSQVDSVQCAHFSYCHIEKCNSSLWWSFIWCESNPEYWDKTWPEMIVFNAKLLQWEGRVTAKWKRYPATNCWLFYCTSFYSSFSFFPPISFHLCGYKDTRWKSQKEDVIKGTS